MAVRRVVPAHDGDIQRAAAQIEGHEGRARLDLRRVAEGRGGGFVQVARTEDSGRLDDFIEPVLILLEGFDRDGEGDFHFGTIRMSARGQKNLPQEIPCRLEVINGPTDHMARELGLVADEGLHPAESAGHGRQEILFEHLLAHPDTPGAVVVHERGHGVELALVRVAHQAQLLSTRGYRAISSIRRRFNEKRRRFQRACFQRVIQPIIANRNQKIREDPGRQQGVGGVLAIPRWVIPAQFSLRSLRSLRLNQSGNRKALTSSDILGSRASSRIGTGPVVALAKWCEVQAQLHIRKGRLEEALACLEKAIEHRREGFNRSCEPSPYAIAALARDFETLAKVRKRTGDEPGQQKALTEAKAIWDSIHLPTPKPNTMVAEGSDRGGIFGDVFQSGHKVVCFHV